MQPSTLPRKYFIVASVALVFIVYLWTNDDVVLPKTAWGNSHSGLKPGSNADVFDFAPVESQALRDICSSTKWNESLIFTCDNNHGAVANVRNSILNCVRYAIGAGGSLVIPRISKQNPDDEMGQHKPHHEPERQGFEYMFDLNHFSQSLQRSCPELVLVQKLKNSATARRRKIQPESLFPNLPTSGLEHPEEWPQRLGEWIQKKISPSPSAKEPIIIDLKQSFLFYPTQTDGREVAHIFGDILKFRSDVRQLATKTLSTIVELYQIPVNISNHGILKPSFAGAHLEIDDHIIERRHQIDIEFSHYEAQFESYTDLSTDLKIPIIYLASGDLYQMKRFSAEALEQDLTVTYKEILLKDNDLVHLQRLTDDQRAMVDYLVLTRAESFMGVGHSPLSWNVALAREKMSSVEGKLTGDVWEDGISTLFGVRTDYVESSSCMWA